MQRLTQQPHVGRDVRWTKENPVHPVGPPDHHGGGKGGTGFDLGNDRSFLFHPLEIVADPPEPIGAGAGGHAAHPAWRIAAGRNRPRRLIAALHHGKDQTLRADIQDALDLDGVVPVGPHQRRHPVTGQHLQLPHDRGDLVRRMFHVDHGKVERSTRHDLGRIGAA